MLNNYQLNQNVLLTNQEIFHCESIHQAAVMPAAIYHNHHYLHVTHNYSDPVKAVKLDVPLVI
jgi:hypothetical protein